MKRIDLFLDLGGERQIEMEGKRNNFIFVFSDTQLKHVLREIRRNRLGLGVQEKIVIASEHGNNNMLSNLYFQRLALCVLNVNDRDSRKREIEREDRDRDREIEIEIEIEIERQERD